MINACLSPGKVRQNADLAGLRTGQPLHTITQWVVLKQQDLPPGRSSGRENKEPDQIVSEKKSYD
jgi:hypothetical protein